MATRFRLTSDTTAPDISPAFQSYSHTNTARRILLTTDTSALTTTAYTPDAADHLVAGDAAHVQFVSDALVAQTFSAGDAFKYAIQCLEANAGNNLQTQIWIGLYSNDGSTLLATLRSKVADTSPAELATTLTNRFYSGTFSGGYTCVGGERLVVEFSFVGTPTAAGGVQGHNGSMRWGGNGAGGDLPEDDTTTGTTFNPWIEFDTLILSLPIVHFGQYWPIG